MREIRELEAFRVVWDRSLFTEGLVPLGNGLGKINFVM